MCYAPLRNIVWALSGYWGQNYGPISKQLRAETIFLIAGIIEQHSRCKEIIVNHNHHNMFVFENSRLLSEYNTIDIIICFRMFQFAVVATWNF